MPYVARTNGIVTGIFRQLQAGIAEEFLPDNDPEVVAYLTPKVRRSLLDIITDLNALAPTQKNNVWNDLTIGPPANKWQSDSGINAAAIAVLQFLATTGTLNATDLLNAKIRGVAMYVQDNPGYLVRPAFDLTINIPGQA